jgi:hypothetical protein
MAFKLQNGDKVEINYNATYRKPYPETLDGATIGDVVFDRGWQEGELSVDIGKVTYSGIRCVLLVKAKE